MKVLRSYANPVHKPRPHSRINMPRWRKCPLSWQTTSCVRSRNLEHLRLYYIGSTWIIWNILKTFLNRLLFPWPKIIFKLNSRAKFHHVHYTKGQIKFFQCGKNMQNSTERTDKQSKFRIKPGTREAALLPTTPLWHINSVFGLFFWGKS